MLPRPAWLAIGVVAAAAAAQVAGSYTAAEAAVAASAMAVGLVGAACAFETAGPHRRAPSLGPALAAASLGAAIVATRLAVGAMAGGDGPGTVPLPTGTGPWQATVESARESNGQQLATLDVTVANAGAGPIAGAGLNVGSTASPGAVSTVRCSAVVPAFPRLLAGDRVAWSGRVRPLGNSGYEAWLAAQGIAATCEPTQLEVVGHDDSPAGRLEGFRQASGDALERVLPEPEGGLAAAILIGLRDRVDKDVAADFTTAGVSHIVAISGWNISIVAATVAALLGGLFSRRRRAIVTIAVIVAYSLFAGMSPSVVRAAVMAGVALLAVESGRGSRAMVGLAWAVGAMLVVEPGTVGDVGFELSAAATAGLVAWATPLTRRLETAAPWLPGPLRESLGVSLAAQAATLPIALLAFGRLALIAPAANLVAVPLVPPAMAAGTLALVAGWLGTLGPSWLGGMLGLPAWALLAGLIWVVHVAASIPGANETLPFPANASAASAACLGLSWLHRQLIAPQARGQAVSPRAAGVDRAARRPGRSRPNRRRPHWRSLATAAFVVALAGCVVASRPDGAAHVIVLDVGQGDAILLQGDHGGRILVDGGPDGNALLRVLDRYVPAWDRRLDAIVLTHPHDDHVAGLVSVVDNYRVGKAFESGWAVSTPTYRAWLVALAAHGIRPERLRTGDALRLDDVTLHVLWPDDGTVRPPYLDSNATANRKANDASIVLMGDYENRRFLLMGDAEDDIDPILLGRGLPVVDMLKVAHHGSATASSDELLAAVRPGVAAISVGAANTYGHPAPSTMSRLRAHARTILRTDQVGTIETTLDAAAVTISSGRAPGAADDTPATARPVLTAFCTVAEPRPTPLAADPRPVLAGGGAAAGPRLLPAADGTPGRAGLLYDSIYVSPEPSRKRGLAALARATGLASPPLAGRGRDGGLARAAGGIDWSLARSPPRGSGRSPA